MFLLVNDIQLIKIKIPIYFTYLGYRS